MLSIGYIVSGSVLVAATTLLIEETINVIIRRAARAADVRPYLIRDVSVALRVIAFLIIASSILSLTGLSDHFTSLTISGIAALAVSLALQSSLTNVIAGILLINQRAIRVDDVIEYGSVKGKVVRIALINTWLLLDSGKVAVISNSNLSNGPLINHTATERLSKRYGFS